MSRAIEGNPKVDELALKVTNEIKELRNRISELFPHPQVLARNLDSKTLRRINLEFKLIIAELGRYTAHFDNYHSVRVEQSAKSQINKVKKVLGIGDNCEKTRK